MILTLRMTQFAFIASQSVAKDSTSHVFDVCKVASTDIMAVKLPFFSFK